MVANVGRVQRSRIHRFERRLARGCKQFAGVVLEPSEVLGREDGRDVPRRIGRIDHDERVVEGPLGVPFGIEFHGRVPAPGGLHEGTNPPSSKTSSSVRYPENPRCGAEVAPVRADSLQERLRKHHVVGESLIQPRERYASWNGVRSTAEIRSPAVSTS